jgi:hypothetical protein
MGLVVFRSKAAAEIFMFAETAQRMLQIIGKDDTPRGIIQAPEVGAALQRLAEAVDAEKTALREARLRQQTEERAGQPGGDPLPPITLGQRAYPLIEMLRSAQKKQVDVTWGV